MLNGLTFKEWCDVPHVDASSLHELAQSDLQEEDRNTPKKYKQYVGNEKDTCRGERERAKERMNNMAPNNSMKFMHLINNPLSLQSELLFFKEDFH